MPADCAPFPVQNLLNTLPACGNSGVIQITFECLLDIVQRSPTKDGKLHRFTLILSSVWISLPWRRCPTPPGEIDIQEMEWMSLPIVDRSVFSTGTVPRSVPKTQPPIAVGPRVNDALPARVMIAVTLFGAAFWYLLWRVALYFEAAH